MALALLLLFTLPGCRKPDPAFIRLALASTNVLFQPILERPLALSPHQADVVKLMVRHYEDRSQFRVEREILPAFEGAFILGKCRFGWLPGMLCARDPEAGVYYVVEDPKLAKMGEAFFKALGPAPPLRSPSSNEWRRILTALE